MSNVGLFLEKHFVGKKIEIYLGEESEYINYSDTSTFNRAIVCGEFVSYDMDSGTLIFKTEDGEFYINELYVRAFWRDGFNYTKTLKNSINTGKKFQTKDIL